MGKTRADRPSKARARRTAAEQATKAGKRREGCPQNEDRPCASSRRRTTIRREERSAGPAYAGHAATTGKREDDDERVRFRPLRSGAGKEFLRGRIYCRHQGPQVAQDRRGRADDPAQSRASRRGRRRSARRRRRRHSGADAAQILRQEGGRARLHAAAARPLRASARCSCRTTRPGGRKSWTPTRRSPRRKA